MLIKCSECGADLSSLAKSCPRCGCPNKSSVGKSKIAVASFVLGIFDAIYAFAYCVSVYHEQKNFEFMFMVIVLTILSTVFGMVSLSKKDIRKKSIVAIALGAVSAIAASIASIM